MIFPLVLLLSRFSHARARPMKSPKKTQERKLKIPYIFQLHDYLTDKNPPRLPRRLQGVSYPIGKMRNSHRVLVIIIAKNKGIARVPGRVVLEMLEISILC